MAAQRTLLLAPPSISSHPEALTSVADKHDRSTTDIQMLDRLAMGLVTLPATTYDLILLLSEAPSDDPTHAKRSVGIDRMSMTKIVQSLRPGGRLKCQDGKFTASHFQVRTEAILAGLVNENDGESLVKPQTSDAGESVKLSFGKRANAAAVPLNAVEAANTADSGGESAKRKIMVESSTAPAGVGFVDFVDDLDVQGDDDYFPTDEELRDGDMIDPDTLLTDEDRQRPIILPEECKPNGKRRRACKDCSCGLKQKLEAEDAAKRTTADKALQSLKLGSDELSEVDFTVQGKVGSCGNCALGDAFRCDGCPYIGLPAFKPGEEVRLLNNDVQL